MRFGFTCLTFLRKKSCMNGKKNLYTVSVKLSYLFQFLAHSPFRLELNMVHGHIQTPKSQAADTLVWSTSFFFPSEHYHIAFLLRILSNHTLPWINSTTFLPKNQNQFDLGISPFPNEIEMQYLTFLGVCRYCLVYSIYSRNLVCKRDGDACK